MLDRRLLGLLRLAPLPAALSVLASLLSVAAALVQAVALARLIGGLLGADAIGTVDVTGPVLLALGAGLARAGLLWLRDICSAWTASTVKASVRADLVAAVLRLGPGWLATRPSGDVRATLSDGVEALQAYVGYYLPQVAVAVLAPLGLVAFLVAVDPVVGLTVAVAAAVVPVARPLWRRLLGERGAAFWDAYAALSARVLEALQGMSTLKLHNATGRYEREVVHDADRVARAAVGNLRAALGVHTLVTVAFGVGTAAAVAVAALRYATGALDLVGMVVVLVLAAECFRPLLDLQNYWHEGFYGISAAKGMAQVLETEPLVSDGPQPLAARPSAPEVRLDGVSYRYPGVVDEHGAWALHDVDLVVPGGCTVGLVGRSGAGKSTVVHLLQRFDDPTRGAVLVDGTDLRTWPLADARSLVAVVSQDTYLFHASVADNLRLARPGASDEELVEAARAAHAHEFVSALPDGYATLVGERGARLSGGQRQRVAIARALLADAPVLVLDEATSAVDGAGEREVQEALERVREGRTTLVVAHRLSTVVGADQVAVLESGRVVEAGPPQELLARDGSFARLVEAQRVVV